MENISGIIKIEYAFREDVATLRINLSTSFVEEITFIDSSASNRNNRNKWSPFYFTPQTAELQITPKLSDFGLIYACAVKSRSPKDRPEATAFVRAAQSCWFLLRITDANGIARLIGTTDFPAKFSAGISIPPSPAGYNGYDLDFTSYQLTPPVYFH